MSTIALVAYGLLAVAAVIAWAAAWQTMHWLGRAEDLLERTREDCQRRGFVYGPLERYERHTPRRA